MSSIHSTRSWTGIDYFFFLQSVSQLEERLGRNGFLLGRNNAEPWELEVLSVLAGINCGIFYSRRLSFGGGTAEGKDVDSLSAPTRIMNDDEEGNPIRLDQN